ncbi:hypothetical protein MRX96_029142 [Rhipicephalus microplus]
MAGWSSSSTRRRSFSSAVRIASPSPASSCSNRSFGLASPSPIRISGIASGRAHTKSPSATSAPVGSASSKTARLTVRSAGAQSPKPDDFTRTMSALGYQETLLRGVVQRPRRAEGVAGDTKTPVVRGGACEPTSQSGLRTRTERSGRGAAVRRARPPSDNGEEHGEERQQSVPGN